MAATLNTIPSALGQVRFWPDAASQMAHQVDSIFGALIAFTGFFIITICFLVVFFAAKYRAGVETDRTLREGTTVAVELAWIVAPFVLVCGIFAWAATVFAHARVPPPDARTIYVVGRQWMWKIEHPQGRAEINELHLPAGEPVKLVMTSQDVIHSFFVPAFRVKQDVLPGRYTTMWFNATAPGEYHLFCAEYCGSDHALMRGRIVVMKPSDFERWLEAEGPVEGPAPASGMVEVSAASPRRGAFFEFGCQACHWTGATVPAPRLGGLFGRSVKLADGTTLIADENYLRESILDPNAKIVAGYASPSVMPAYRGQLKERDIIRLIEFIKSFEENGPEEGP